MIIRKIKDLLSKSSSDCSAVTVTSQDPSNNYVSDLANILQVQPPEIEAVAIIFDDGQVKVMYDLDPSSIPANAKFIGGYYSDQGKIYIATKYPDGMTFRNYTDAEILFVKAHELRHVWQMHYHFDEYKHNAVHEETITDPAEIDADAFALAYVLCNTPYGIDQLPFVAEELSIVNKVTNYARIAKALSLAQEYSFGNVDKLSVIRG